MKIGIVTTWYERGAAYVSRIYMDLLHKSGHEVFIYSRAGQNPPKGIEKWNEDYVTRDNTYRNFQINKHKFFCWIKKNNLNVILFNEQQDFRIVAETKRRFPDIKLAAYVDYYTERTRKWFVLYDFLICNTKRHMQAMEGHPQKYYMQWGTDTKLYRPSKEKHDILTFFHSVGMSTRKGTDILIEAFIEGECFKKSKLIIHTQRPIEDVCNYKREFLEQNNIQIIEKTVTAPGLYYMGDVYVYPTRLDGLGLTMYEALSSGLPVITSDFPPMNEAVNNECGKLIKIKDYYCRQDAYYYPLVVCDKEDLIRKMQWYIDNPEQIIIQKEAARRYAVEHYEITDRYKELSRIFETAKIRKLDTAIYKDVMWYYKKEINTIHQYTDNRTWIYNLKCKIIKMMRR